MMFFKTEICYRALAQVIGIFILAVYGFLTAISTQTNWKTIIYHMVVCYLGLLGNLLGAHRLWSHRSYETNRVIQFILILFETHSAHPPVFKWARDHRVHHKYVDTDADPYNVKRGLFFAQIGHFCVQYTEEFQEKVKTINVEDLKGDALIMFQNRYYPLLLYATWTLSALVPYAFWHENLPDSIFIMYFSIFVSILHVGTINSLSHWWGWKPYDTGIEPTFSRLVTYLTFGEGYHNFHHTFPKDYTQSEFHWSQNFNVSALLLDTFQYFGWVKNTKKVNSEQIATRRQRTGDMTIKIRPWSALMDQIIGLLVVNWAILLIFSIRYLNHV